MQFNELKKIKRFKEIVSILLKYGFDEIVQRMDIPGAEYIKKIGSAKEETSLYSRIRLALEDLGPTFVKFGQIMSLRPDFLPQELLDELEKLQDDVAGLEFEDIEAVVSESFGKPINEVFSVFDIEPIAAASLSQVHRAVLSTEGQIVSVKIQRPGIKDKMRADLDILEVLARFLDENFEGLKTHDLPELANVIRRNLLNELDFTIESRNMKIARSFADDTEIYIPEVYDHYCSEKIIVMEFVNGAKYSEGLADPNCDNEHIAKQGLKAAVKQVLEDGFFHADPHPGNLLITEDMNLSIIDWGVVGRLTEKERFEMTELLGAVVDKDGDALAHSLIRICQARGKSIQPAAIEKDLMVLLDAYHAVPIKKMNIGQFLMDVMTLLRNHQLKLPTDFVIMIKALVTAEGSARQAYPDLNIVSEISGQVSQLAKRQYRPEVLWRNLRNVFSDIWASQRELPRQIQNIISKLDSGDLSFRLHLNKMERIVNTLESASNRMTTGIITGAIIMGSSMIITTGVDPFLFGFPALGVIGYLLSVVLGLWLVITILRTRKY